MYASIYIDLYIIVFWLISSYIDYLTVFLACSQPLWEELKVLGKNPIDSLFNDLH